MTGGARQLAMFPLGSVLLPGMVLPLHVFEERYRRLVADVLAAEVSEFGVVLIERGSEVGGGDIRAMVGCTARVVEAAPADDGRWALVAVGTEPFEVAEWLPDGDYPQALVRPAEDDGPVPDDAGAALARLVGLLQRCAAMTTELGVAAPIEIELSDDPWLATYHAAVLAPLGALDRQRVLATRSPAARLLLVEELLEEQATLLEGRLRLGPSGDADPLA